MVWGNTAKIRKVVKYFVFLAVTACQHAKTIVETDLDFIKNQIQDNHPGIYNHSDPDFAKTLNANYQKAFQKIQSLSTTTEKNILESFVQSFKDSHVYIHWHGKLTDKKNYDFSITEIDSYTIWITVPTFVISISQQNDFKKILDTLPKYRKKQRIIFDLRHNSGGNSEHGSNIVDSLFGKENGKANRSILNKNVYVEWRASKDNLNHINKLSTQQPSEWLNLVAKGSAQSLKTNHAYYKEEFKPAHIHSAPINCETVDARIYVIIHNCNVSAALDFIDELKLIHKNVRLVGASTKSDTDYMELREITLPSGLGNFYFPIKVYRNRLRPANYAYHPDIPLDTRILDSNCMLDAINCLLKKIKN